MVGFGILFVVVLLAFVIEKKPWGWKGYEIIASWRERGLQGISAFWAWITDLKTLYVFFASIIGLALLVLFVLLYSRIILIPFDLSKLEDINTNFALAFLGTVSSFGALFGIYLAIQRTDETKRTNEIADDTNKITERQNEIANRQANTAEQESITARIDRATDGLGKKDGNTPIIEARIGALISLEQIAQDNIRYHISVMEILCAYVRNNSPTKDKPEDLREDIQTAITIIGRRGAWTDGDKGIKKERDQRYTLTLNNCNLRKAHLPMANLSHAIFINTNFSDARLSYANLSDSWINISDLTGAMLKGTNMKNAQTVQAYAYKGNFSQCENLTQEQLDVMYCGIQVRIPDDLKRPKSWPTDNLSYNDFINAHKKEMDKMINNLMQNPNTP